MMKTERWVSYLKWQAASFWWSHSSIMSQEQCIKLMVLMLIFLVLYRWNLVLGAPPEFTINPSRGIKHSTHWATGANHLTYQSVPYLQQGSHHHLPNVENNLSGLLCTYTTLVWDTNFEINCFGTIASFVIKHAHWVATQVREEVRMCNHQPLFSPRKVVVHIPNKHWTFLRGVRFPP